MEGGEKMKNNKKFIKSLPFVGFLGCKKGETPKGWKKIEKK